MAARLTVLVPRIVGLVLLWLLAAASYTLAAGGGGQSPSPAPAAGATEEAPETLVVPDVRGQTYVFAKGILQDAGFNWKVNGSVQGYAANIVSVQTPAPSVRVVDNGSPTVALVLERNPDYEERGLPQNTAPYAGTAVVLLSDWRAAQAQPESEPPVEEPATQEPAAPEPAEPPATESEPAEEEPAEPAAEPRKPDFAVPGAPAEPADEMPLPERARRLEALMDATRKPRDAVLKHWLYQHSWIVTGARFGWADGEEALRILLRVDRKLEKRFGVGARSAKVAERALAYVQSRKR